MIKEINKLIKPYLIKVDKGGCYIKIPLSEWDFMLAEILEIAYRDIIDDLKWKIDAEFKEALKK